MRSKFKFWLINITIIILILMAWEFLISNQDNVNWINNSVDQAIGFDPEIKAFSPYILPRPSQILNAFLNERSGGRGGVKFFFYQGSITLKTALIGFVLGNIFAFFIATLFFYVKPMERTFMPFALALKSIPLVAIIPLFLRLRYSVADLPAVQESSILHFIFGTDLFIKTVIVVIAVFFPTLVNTFRGIQSASKPSLEFMESINATKWLTFWKLRLPTALPMIYSALKITAVLAVGGAILSEWLSTNNGLGYIMAAATSSGMYNVYELWVSLFITSIFAFGLYSLVTLMEKITIPWHESVIALKQAMGED